MLLSSQSACSDSSSSFRLSAANCYIKQACNFVQLFIVFFSVVLTHDRKCLLTAEWGEKASFVRQITGYCDIASIDMHSDFLFTIGTAAALFMNRALFKV